MITVNEAERVAPVVLEKTFARLREKSLESRQELISTRKRRLKKLLTWLLANRARVKEAVFKDFRKPAVEVDISEIYPVISEIRHTLSNLDDWVKPMKIDASITYLGTRSEVRYEPKGVCLIIAPWNFPFNLCLGPLVSCLAAGNVAILKPSEATPNTSKLIAVLVNEVFDGEVEVVEGDKGVAADLLKLPFDHIFFTGSPAVGKIVMKAAATHLSSVTLELGGKSPVIIHESANIKDTAKRIAFGKFLNNGQTFIAPDYVLVDARIKEKFIQQVKHEIISQFGDGKGVDKNSGSYGRIVNNHHLKRLKSLWEDALNLGVIPEMSGEISESDNYFHPAIISEVPQNAQLMEEEIFGPILPVLTFNTAQEVIQFVNSKPKPLALYVFSTQRKFTEEVVGATSSGTVCINDCVTQFTHPNLPFGGVNNSGIGKSHGRYGFVAFSNEKPVLKQKRGFAMAYFFHPPFTRRMSRLLEAVIRWF